MAIYGAMSGLGIIIGLILGGVLTGTFGWRWAFFINIPIGLAVLAGSGRLVEAELHKGRPDLIGAISSIGGMAALVYGITRGGEHGWTDNITLISFAMSAVLLPLFIFIQSHSKNPLVPLRLFTDRNRAGSYIATLLLGFGPMGMLYLMTLYMQHILEYSPIYTALAFLPFSVGIVFGAVISSKLLTRFSPRQVAAPGSLIGAVALFWLSNIGQEISLVWHFIPAIFLTAFGFVMGVISLALTAVKGVQANETGVASALFNASQQVGVALGLAILSTMAISSTARKLPDALSALHHGREIGDSNLIDSAGNALIHGYAHALIGGGIVFVLAAIIVAMFVNAKHDISTANNNNTILH